MRFDDIITSTISEKKLNARESAFTMHEKEHLYSLARNMTILQQD